MGKEKKGIKFHYAELHSRLRCRMNALDAGQGREPFNVTALENYLRSRISGFAGPVSVSRFKGGQSNPTYLLTTPAHRYVMRCKPAPVAQLLPSAHAVEREFRLQQALAGSAVPVSRMYCLCEDEAVIGRAFYVMDFVEGRIFWEQSLPGMEPGERAALYDELNRVIAALHAVDFNALGLSDYGKAGNYFSRQVDRWTRQYRASETGRVEAMETLIDWLPRTSRRKRFRRYRWCMATTASTT